MAREAFHVGPPDVVVERARAFVRSCWSDADGEDDVRADLRHALDVSPDTVRNGLAALQSALGDPSKAWTLTYLVEIDANHSMDDCTEASARLFLDRLVALTRDLIQGAGPVGGTPR